MAKTFDEPILNQSIQDMDASDAFKLVTGLYGYRTLADLLQIKNPYDLLHHPGFDYHLLAEYTGILEKNQVAHYLN